MYIRCPTVLRGQSRRVRRISDMCLIVTLAVLAFANAHARPDVPECSVRACTEAGWVCGSRRLGENGLEYASFRGVPYAKQPLGELRFKELQPVERWRGLYDATEEGPICPQRDVLYGRIMQPRAMSEECIHANIHVPLENLPDYHDRVIGLEPPYQSGLDSEENAPSGLPVVVFIHGGGFAFGSGDSDLHGPEYLISKRVIVITFNYRLNVFGFLSLNTTSVPGNNGLRDMVTLLRWVRRNARAFGGDPNDVTLAGQSAGAASAHLLSMSDAAEGLFKRIWIMSGTGPTNFFTTTPAYAQFVASTLLTVLGINSTDPEDIHRQLVNIPLEKIVDANGYMLDLLGLTTFVPVVESPLPGITRIVADDPEVLVSKGRGKDIPIVIGFTDAECETFRSRFEAVDIISQINTHPMLVVPAQLIYTMQSNDVQRISNAIHDRYFNGTVNMDDFVRLCSDSNFVYPAIKLATTRASIGGAPVFLYQFSYHNDHSVIKEGLGISFKGVGHIEDLTYIFRSNSILGRESYISKDYQEPMKEWLTAFFTNFVYTSQPTNSVYEEDNVWPALREGELKYQNIGTPGLYYYENASDKLRDMKNFFDSLVNSK
ncbi:juvenile hormone esterase-like [Galleria mellonella]|uniref:Carboxylic ester hydrolase n=1 Tax=Galleria mellonella TaxID=7137 RepID=A0ABM3MZ31_GALME|nr:juvenile hormone esterase-like [Galleria mellonella]